jgi:hypothetical protein
MSEFFEKVAAENEGLADVIIKVADEEVVSQLNEEEQLDAFLDALEAEGVDLNDPKVLEELKTASADDIYTYNLANVTEIISEDICKVAAGEPGFETAAAATFSPLRGAKTCNARDWSCSRRFQSWRVPPRDWFLPPPALK